MWYTPARSLFLGRRALVPVESPPVRESAAVRNGVGSPAGRQGARRAAYADTVFMLDGEPMDVTGIVVHDVRTRVTYVHMTSNGFLANRCNTATCQGCGAPLDKPKCDYCEREH